MQIETRQEGNCTIIAISGSVDAMTAAELTKAIDGQIANEHINIVVDLTGLDFMSSAGLRALLGAVKATRSQGGDMRIVSTHAGIDKVLKMSGFHNIAKVFTSQTDASASFDS